MEQVISLINEYIDNGCKYFNIYSTKIKSLIQQGAAIDDFDAYKNNALNIACYKGNSELVEFLVKNGASPNIVDPWGYTPLFACIVDSKIDQAKILLDNGANINYIDSKGNTPLDYCYIYRSHQNDLLAEYIESLGGITNNVVLQKTNPNLEQFNLEQFNP